MSPWLSVVIPTVGRTTLVDTLDALDAQGDALLDGVEVIVVGDTFGGMTAQLQEVREHVACERMLGRYRFLECDGGQHMYGQPQRTAGAHAARGEWVWFGQDDNVATEHALESIYCATRSPLSGLLIFRWVSPWREVIWRWPDLQLGNIDADCLVMRRDVAHAVRWGMRYEGDYDVAQAAHEFTGRAEIDWQTPVVSVARPDNHHRWWR